MFVKNEQQIHRKLCVTLAEVCPKGTISDVDDSSAESDSYDFEREEL